MQVLKSCCITLLSLGWSAVLRDLDMDKFINTACFVVVSQAQPTSASGNGLALQD